ncbi:MAG TPA: surface-adhesin E family protein [Nitrospiraceae bacterium]|nr:surface-adhesin E family protein [Nitrospiraceae bacterium]
MNRCKLKNNHHKLPPACALGFWSLITLLVLTSGSVNAEWVAIEKDYLSPGLQTVYIDPDSIRREGNLVALWQLINFKWMQGSARGPARFMSTKTHKQFDCGEKRVRLLEYTDFSRQMGTGIPTNGYVDSDIWMPVEPHSMNQALWEVACENRGNPVGSLSYYAPRGLVLSKNHSGLLR